MLEKQNCEEEKMDLLIYLSHNQIMNVLRSRILLEKEKKPICKTLEVFQEGLTSRAVTDSTKKETAGRKSMSSESGKLSRK